MCYRERRWGGVGVSETERGGGGERERERERDHSSNIDNLLLDPILNMHKLISHVQQFYLHIHVPLRG